MILTNTINSLTEDELSLLFFIGQKFFSWEINFSVIKALRVDIVIRLLDILKPQALEEKQDIFVKLKEKLLSQ